MQRYRTLYRNSVILIFQFRHSKPSSKRLSTKLMHSSTGVPQTACLNNGHNVKDVLLKCYKIYSVLKELGTRQSYGATHLNQLELHIDFKLVRL